MRTMVIGLGNPLCADDAAGLEVVRRVAATGGLPPAVAVVEAGCPGLGLLDLMANAERVILVDGVVSGAPPGTLHRFTLDALPPRTFLPLSLHGVNAVDALELGHTVAPEQMPAEVVILGVELADRTPFREGLSQPVLSSLADLADAIRREIGPLA